MRVQRVHELKAKLVEQFTQLNTLLFTITDMGDAAAEADDTLLEHAMHEAHWSVGEARRVIIVALSHINKLTEGESK